MAKPAPMLGNVFLSLTNNLSLYSVYCNHQAGSKFTKQVHFPGASETIDQCLKSSSAFKQFIDKCVQVRFSSPETYLVGSKYERARSLRLHYKAFSANSKVSSSSQGIN